MTDREYPHRCDMSTSSEGRADATGLCGAIATRAFVWDSPPRTLTRFRCPSCPAPSPFASSAPGGSGFREITLGEAVAIEVMET